MTSLYTLAGLGALYALLLLWGVLVPLPLWGGVLLAVLLAAGAFWRWRDAFNWRQLIPLGQVLLLSAPIFYIVSGSQPAQWDEFSHWLWAGWELWQTQRFPLDSAASYTSFPAYPQFIGLVFYLPALLLQQFPQLAVAFFNTALVGLFGLSVVQLAQGKSAVGWRGAALAVFFGFALNPVFVPKLTFVAYADVMLGVSTTVLVFALWQWLKQPQRTVLPWLVTGIAVALVGTKQVGLVLWFMALFGAAFLAVLQPQTRAHVWRLWPALVVPIIAYALWRWHVGQHLTGAEFMFRPLGEWLWADWQAILGSAFGVMQRKGHLFVPLLGLTLYGLPTLWAKVRPQQQLALLAAAVGWGYVVFLLVTYFGAFTRGEALMTASFWRYSTHIGWLVWGATLLALWPVFAARIPRWVSAVMIPIVIALPFVFKDDLTFHNDEGKDGLRALAQAATAVVPAQTVCAQTEVPQALFGHLMLRWLWRDHIVLADAHEVESSCTVTLNYNPMTNKHAPETGIVLSVSRQYVDDQITHHVWRWQRDSGVTLVKLP